MGCMIWIVLLAAAGYLGLQFGRPYFRSQQFREEMKKVAEFAQNISDSAMRVRVNAVADSLGLPVAAKRNLRITRIRRPPHLVIESEYADTVRLPFIGMKILTFKPQVQEPL
jgi:hypothetical protein